MIFKGLSERSSDSQSVQRQFPEHPDPIRFLTADAATDAFGLIAADSHAIPNAAAVSALCGWQLQTGSVRETASPKFGQPEVGEFGEPGLHDWGRLSVASQAF